MPDIACILTIWLNISSINHTHKWMIVFLPQETRSCKRSAMYMHRVLLRARVPKLVLVR